MDPQLVGKWKVRERRMTSKQMVKLIAGLPGDQVEFTKDNRYVVFTDRDPEPFDYICQCHKTEPLAIDVWVKSMKKGMAKCIYSVEGDERQICVCGNTKAYIETKRPTEIKQDDDQLWCVIVYDRISGE